MPPIKPRKPAAFTVGRGGATTSASLANAVIPSVRIAVNILDLDRLDASMRGKLLGGKLDLEAGPVRIDPNRVDETAVAFSCDAVHAAAICDVLRSHDRKAGDPPTRCYVFRKTWSKVPGGVHLSVVDEHGKVMLNPALFSVQLAAGEAVPLETPVFRLGGG